MPDRTDLSPLLGPLRRFLGERQPRGVGWAHTTGSILLALAVLQIVTGLLLAIFYAPSVDVAWESVRYIDREVPMGWFIRGLHHWGASAFVVLILLHMAVVFVAGAYKKPRRVLWVVGVLLLLVVLGFGYTGYLLPWDVDAYFGTEVGTAIPGTTPGIGPRIQELLRGGEEIGQLTLTRFYAAHVILLPLLLIALTAIHLTIVRRLGVTPPWRRVGEGESEDERDGETFAPYQLGRDSVAVMAVVVAVALLAMRFPPETAAKADPSAAAVPQPDWYFLGLQHLLRVFPANLQYIGTVVLPNLAIALLLLVPVLDRKPDRAPRARKLILGVGAVATGLVVWLTIAGWQAVSKEERKLALRLEAMREAPPPVRSWTETDPDPAKVAAGAKLYEGLGCAGCHPATDPEPNNYAATMSFEGDRAWRGWIADYMRAPHRMAYDTDEKNRKRPTARMPTFRLTDGAIDALSHYLSAQRKPTLFTRKFDPGKIDRGMIEQGKMLFAKRLCGGCHRVTPADPRGRIGPDLMGVSRRLKPDFMWAIIKNPYRINPASEMKNLQLSDAEIDALVAYLTTLE